MSLTVGFLKHFFRSFALANFPQSQVLNPSNCSQILNRNKPQIVDKIRILFKAFLKSVVPETLFNACVLFETLPFSILPQIGETFFVGALLLSIHVFFLC